MLTTTHPNPFTKAIWITLAFLALLVNAALGAEITESGTYTFNPETSTPGEVLRIRDGVTDVEVIGFTTTNPTWGVAISIGLDTARIVIRDFKITKATKLAIEARPRTSADQGKKNPADITIRDGRFEKCTKAVIAQGRNWLVENNEVFELRSYSPLFDVDAFRMFGDGHTFRGNRIWGADPVLEMSKKFHVDGFQTFILDGKPGRATNITIEDNFIADVHQAFLIQNYNDSDKMDNWTIRNNIVTRTHAWIAEVRGAHNVNFTGNIFYGYRPGPQGIGFVTDTRYGATSDGTVRNNIFMDGKVTYWANPGSQIGGSGNIVWDITQGTRQSDTKADPLFVDPDNGDFRVRGIAALAMGFPGVGTEPAPTPVPTPGVIPAPTAEPEPTHRPEPELPEVIDHDEPRDEPPPPLTRRERMLELIRKARTDVGEAAVKVKDADAKLNQAEKIAGGE